MGESIAVAGGQPWATTYLLDGTLHNNSFDNLNLPLPFPDALQEFKVETSSLTAENGIHSGGAVNMVTKGGTNSFHGDIFEFFRNGDLNGRNAFSTLPDILKRNQFGGTVGGRIIKDKLFLCRLSGHAHSQLASGSSGVHSHAADAQRRFQRLRCLQWK